MITMPPPAPTTTLSDRPAVSDRGRRIAAVICLVATPLAAGVSELLQPDVGNNGSDRLTAMAGTPSQISAVAFLIGQLPMMVSVLVIGQLVARKHPRLGSWGAALGFLGAFGHTVFGGMSLAQLVMAADPKAGHRAAYAELVDTVNNSPIMVFSLLGLVGTILGLLLLSIGLLRAHVGPVWVGPALWVFLVAEFVGTSFVPAAVYLSVACFGASLFALAIHIARQPA